MSDENIRDFFRIQLALFPLTLSLASSFSLTLVQCSEQFRYEFLANRIFHANYETSIHTESQRINSNNQTQSTSDPSGEDIDKRGVAFIQKSLIMWNEIYFSCSNVSNNKRTNNGAHPEYKVHSERVNASPFRVKYKLPKRPMKPNTSQKLRAQFTSGRETCDIANSIDKMTSETYVNYVHFFRSQWSFDILHSRCTHQMTLKIYLLAREKSTSATTPTAISTRDEQKILPKTKRKKYTAKIYNERERKKIRIDEWPDTK